MESSLHRELKALALRGRSGRVEAIVDGFRVDALTDDGEVVEVQTGALGPLRRKLDRLLPAHAVRLVKPVALRRRLVQRARRDGPDGASRRSPYRGRLCDAFDDLVGLASAETFPHPNLRIDVLGVEVVEVRVPLRRGRGYLTVDRRLGGLSEVVTLRQAADLWRLLPTSARFGSAFTTHDLATALGRPSWFAQKVAYCLRRGGAAWACGKRGHHVLYEPRGLEVLGAEIVMNEADAWAFWTVSDSMAVAPA